MMGVVSGPFLWVGWELANLGVAVTPDEAAKSLSDWIETFDIEKTGQYWAPRGAA